MRGRKPVPAEQRRQEGNRGKRDYGDPVLVGERLDADVIEHETGTALDVPAGAVVVGDNVYRRDVLPDLPHHLALDDELNETEEAAELWYELAALLVDANLLTRGDLVMLTMLAENILEARRAWEELRTGGRVVETLNPASGRASLKASPWHKIWRDSNATVIKLAEQFALTPVARARLGLAIGKGRQIEKELGAGLPENPRTPAKDNDIEGNEIGIN